MILPQFSRPDAVIFDLDGTLVDTAPDLGAALNRLLAERGRPGLPAHTIRTMIGDGAAKLVERGFVAAGGWPDDPQTLVRRFLDIYEAGVADRSRPFPGVAAVLTRLATAGIRLGVCTNKPGLATEELLAALDLRHYFGAVAHGDGPTRKPDPRHLLGAVEQLGATPATSVMIGDSANDVAAARGAGMTVIVVGFGYTATPARELGADLVIDSFEALPELLGV
jgi:phosphoglycolate phosphatase